VETREIILFGAPVLLFSVIAHEYAHGYAALKQGDTTARDLGRLTWNPLKHIDPFLTILMPLMTARFGVMLGGAKPVPVDPRNYRNLRRGDIIVSLAGVAVNFALAFICAALIVILGSLARGVPALEPSVGVAQVMMSLGIQINLMLLMFNLIPIPPLDGSHVMKYLLPVGVARHYQRLGFLGLFIILGVMYFAPGFLRWWLGPATYVATELHAIVGSFLTRSFFSWMS
jgi:Zn-dependent protease